MMAIMWVYQNQTKICVGRSVVICHQKQLYLHIIYISHCDDIMDIKTQFIPNHCAASVGISSRMGATYKYLN